jgi:hypothetical protein
MRKHIIFLFLTFSASIVFGQTDKNNFVPGERLRFVIYYGILDAGVVEADLSSVVYKGVPAYHAKMLARSTGLADKLFKVRDEYQSVFNPVTVLPYTSIRDISEGKYKRFYTDIFNHQTGKVITTKGIEFDIPPMARDMVTVFYYIRNIDFSKMKDGDLIEIVTFFDDEIFPFDMRYRGTEIVKTRKGSFNCIKLVPVVEPGRIFTKEDDMTIWLSNDQNKVPVRIRFDLKVGSVKCDLIEYSGLKH